MMKKRFFVIWITLCLVFPIFAGIPKNFVKVQAFEQTATAFCTANGFQRNPKMTKTTEGNVIVTWIDNRSGNWDVYAQKFDPRGFPLWAHNGVPVCTAALNQYNCKPFSDGYGGAYILWEDTRSSVETDVYAQRLNSSGNPQWDINGIVVCDQPGYQDGVEICYGEFNQEIIVAWRDTRMGPSNWDIYGQKIALNGATLWDDNGIVVCNETGRQIGHKIEDDYEGGAFISWADGRLGSSAENYDIYITHILSDGVNLWGESGHAICNAPGAQFDVDMIKKNIAGVLITWTDNRSGNWDVYIQDIDKYINKYWGFNGIPVCTAEGKQWGAKLCSDGNYGAIVSWSDERMNPVTYKTDLYAQSINSSGVDQWAPNGTIISNAVDDQDISSLISDGENGCIVSWNDGRDSLGSKLYAQRIQLNGLDLWGNNGTEINPNHFDEYWDSDLMLMEPGEAIFAWSDNQNGDYDIWAKYYKDETSPTSSEPDDVICVQRSSQNIEWGLYDNAGEGGYYRVRSGIPEHHDIIEVITWTEWDHGEIVSAPIDSSINGTFFYRIEFNDTFGNFNMDTVFVTITEAPPTTPSRNWIYYVVGGVTLVAIGATIGTIVLVRKRKKV